MKNLIDGVTKFFFYLTRDNWAFPWHIIIAMGLMKIGLWGFSFVDKPYLWSVIILILIINLLVGYPYEVYQRRLFIARNSNNSNYEHLMKKFNKGTKQDLLANFIGSILGAL